MQREMAGVLFTPLTRGGDMRRRAADGRVMREVAESFIKPNDRLTSFERLEIYSRQYWYRVLEGLQEDFPGLRAVLGGARFLKLSEAYLVKHPSSSFTMRNLGRALEGFLRAEPRWAGRRQAIALDVTRLEWAHIEAFDNTALPPLTSDDFLDTPPHRLRVRLQPHLSLLEVSYPVDEIAVAARQEDDGQRGEASNAVEASDGETDRPAIPLPPRERVHLAVHRSENSVFYKRLDPEAYAILTALRDGATVAVACERALRKADPKVDWAPLLQRWFGTWSQFGWFCRRK